MKKQKAKRCHFFAFMNIPLSFFIPLSIEVATSNTVIITFRFLVIIHSSDVLSVFSRSINGLDFTRGNLLFSEFATILFCKLDYYGTCHDNLGT